MKKLTFEENSDIIFIVKQKKEKNMDRLDKFYDTPIMRGTSNSINNRVEYSVNKKTGVITAFIKNTTYHPLEFLISTGILPRDSWAYYYYSNREFQSIISKLIIKGSYSGRARLHPKDKWNEEEGKRIAKARCLYKYNKAMFKALHEFRKIKDKEYSRINNSCEHFKSKMSEWSHYDYETN